MFVSIWVGKLHQYDKHLACSSPQSPHIAMYPCQPHWGWNMTSSNGNIFRVIDHLWIPRTNFDVFFDLRLNKRLSKQSWGWWFEKPSRPLWRNCNDMIVSCWACSSADYTVTSLIIKAVLLGVQIQLVQYWLNSLCLVLCIFDVEYHECMPLPYRNTIIQTTLADHFTTWLYYTQSRFGER